MLALLKLAYALPTVVSAARHLPSFQVQTENTYGSALADVKVPVQLGVMSRCPDALLCESLFNEVLPEVLDKVNMSLVYVAKFDPSDDIFGVKCLHGVEECAGNAQQLCVKKYAPRENWWEFVQCQNYQGRAKIGLPEVALQCAKTAGIDWRSSGVGKCAGFDGSGTGEEGVDLLRQSVELGQDLGITKSCTVLINGRKVCVHDGTWKECEGGHEKSDFVKLIEDEYRRLNEGEASPESELEGSR
ncbi:hypothetical protein DFP72DRAFT_876365 [Ephemerocybe angulata]|uniref:Uncharacterized protein n=1 Tax=Ephemerocybe angulata TaxID=980116 RepID=A0A8H6IE11_9AGAR|nr:hypothetical protein DFP72DRAFT_876365 [Tulosesus angulatus]